MQPFESDTGVSPPLGWNYAKKLEFLTITQLTNFARCPRLGFYSVICQLTEPVPHPALTFGSAIGNAIPELFAEPSDKDKLATSRGFDRRGKCGCEWGSCAHGDICPEHGETGTLIPTQENRVQRALAKFEAVWKDGDSFEDKKRNSYNAIRIIQSYASQKGIGDGLYELVKPPPSLLAATELVSPYELPFAMLVGDLPIPILGSIDSLIRDTLTGKLYVKEGKTTTEHYIPSLADNFRRNPQSMGYPYFARKLGLDVAGTIMEFVSVPDPGKTARAHPKYEVVTCPVNTLPGHDAEFEKWLLRTAHEVLYRLEKRDFPTEISACAPYAYFGRAGFPCRFTGLCDLEAQTGDWTALAGTFVQKRHEPFDLTNLTVEGKEICNG